MLFPWFTYTVAVFRLYFFQNSPCSRAGHVVSFAFSSFYDPRFPLRVLRHGWLMGMLAHFRNLWTSGLDNLQSWTKVLGTVLRDSYFSVMCRFPLKTVHPFRNFLALFPPPTLYKVETRKKFWIHLVSSGAHHPDLVQHCLWGEGRGWTCVNWKTPQRGKSVPRLLSMIVGIAHKTNQFCFVN